MIKMTPLDHLPSERSMVSTQIVRKKQLRLTPRRTARGAELRFQLRGETPPTTKIMEAMRKLL